MSEMSHAEIRATLSRVSGMIEFDILHNRPVPIFMRDVDALRQAAADEHRIENGELVPVIHAHWINSYSPHNHRCSECDAEFTNIRERYCPNCGAVMDEARTGESLSGKDGIK